MTKTVCDFCGKEINPIRRMVEGEVTISKNGRIFDVCNDCKESLNEWLKARIGDADTNVGHKRRRK